MQPSVQVPLAQNTLNPAFIPHSGRPFGVSVALLGVLIFKCAAPGGDQPPARRPGETDGTATLIHRADVVRRGTTNNATVARLWPLYSSSDARMNYVEISGRTGLHFHPDADHKLYVLEGRVTVTAGTNTMIATAGDLIIIPKGVRHCYDVPVKGDRALLLTFDAPPYDPRKTVNLDSTSSVGKKPTNPVNQ